jgi:hypothetical protein
MASSTSLCVKYITAAAVIAMIIAIKKIIFDLREENIGDPFPKVS